MNEINNHQHNNVQINPVEEQPREAAIERIVQGFIAEHIGDPDGHALERAIAVANNIGNGVQNNAPADAQGELDGNPDNQQ